MSQSVLNGYFSMIIIAQFNESTTVEIIEKKMTSIKSVSDLDFIIKETTKSSLKSKDQIQGDIYVVTAQGRNRTGLVSSISTFCSNNNINIIDYDTKLSEEIYSMILDIDIPHDVVVDTIHDELELMADKLGLKIVMQHKNLFETVNEISL